VSRSRLLKKQWLKLTGVVSWLQPVNRGINIDVAILRKKLELMLLKWQEKCSQMRTFWYHFFSYERLKLGTFIQEYSR